MTDEGKNELAEELVGAIRRDGPMTFAAFMEQALYHPRHGFYTRGGGPWGPDRDFVTSVDTGPVFAGLLVRLFRACWESVGSPSSYRLVDAGGGDGRFLDHVRTALAADGPASFGEALEPLLADRCAAGLEDDRLPRRIAFPPEAGDSLGPCCIFANELVDALPVHLVRTNRGRLEEALVHEQSGRLTLGWREPTTPALEAHFRRLGMLPAEGQQAAVGLEAEQWIRAAAGAMASGHLVIIDYGYPAPVLLSPETAADPVRTYRGGREGRGLLDEPGLQDITASVDFSSLAHWAAKAGFTLRGFTDQFRLLQRLAEEVSADPEDWARLVEGGPTPGPATRLRRSMALRSLLTPEGIGGSFRVMVLSRGSVGPLPLFRGLRIPSGFEARIE